MKFKIVVCENFQTIETVVETESANDLVPLIKEIRQSIFDATGDIEEKKKKSTKVETKEVNVERKQRMATKGQIDYLKGLGVVVPDDLTFDEARKLLNELGA